MMRRTELLINATDYRGLIQDLLTKNGRRVSLDQLAVRAQVKSKGVLWEVINGKRPMTANLLPKIMYGLGLKVQMEKHLFELLVLRQEKKLRPPGYDPEKALKDLQRIRARLKSRLKARHPQGKISSVSIYRVYASLNESPPGTSLAEVVAMTGLSSQSCADILKHLEDVKLVTVEAGRYLASAETCDFEGLGEDHGFSSALAEAFHTLERRAKNLSSYTNDLYFLSSFSIDASQQRRFKERLREVIYETLDEFQATPGDKVASIVIGTF